MRYLRKINNNREPAGLEWKILRKLPHVLIGGTLIPLFIAGTSRLFPPEGTAIEIARHIGMIDILSIATGITIWTAVFTVAIGCVTVVLMKGPGYVADGYEVSDSDEPKQDNHRNS